MDSEVFRPPSSQCAYNIRHFLPFLFFLFSIIFDRIICSGVTPHKWMNVTVWLFPIRKTILQKNIFQINSLLYLVVKMVSSWKIPRDKLKFTWTLILRAFSTTNIRLQATRYDRRQPQAKFRPRILWPFFLRNNKMHILTILSILFLIRFCPSIEHNTKSKLILLKETNTVCFRFAFWGSCSYF